MSIFFQKPLTLSIHFTQLATIMNRLESYIAQLRDAIHGDLWIDETFAKKLEPLSAHAAFIQPVDGIHSVAQLVSHLYQWQVSVCNILQGLPRTISAEDSTLDWIANETLSLQGWDALKAAFYNGREELLEYLRTQDDSFLLQTSPTGVHTNEYYILGLIHHDMYHMGQIGLVIRLMK